MLSIKMLKPYYVKEDERFVRVVLAYQYFSLYVDDELYHFVPLEAKEIIIDRKKQKVHNVFDIFVFQRGKKMIYIAVTDLLQLPDFLTHLNSIVQPYITEKENKVTEKKGVSMKKECEVREEEINTLIRELEELNLRRLIDKALEDGEIEQFNQLVARLKLHHK